VLIQVDELQFYRDQLWTAPELLRMTTRPINGTQKADVYSFAIILQEIMFRAEPYFMDVYSPKRTNPQFEPRLSRHTDTASNTMITTAIRLRFDYDASRAPASIRRDSTQAKNEHVDISS